MNKFGKYETRPEGVPSEQPKVKSVLLQTYFTSLMSMVLCVTMFFGTSYAWFTSEVENTANEIYVGTLNVGLYDDKGTNLAGSDTKLFDGSIRWEPGYTALETIQITNEGDLAFKYVLSFTDGTAKNADDSDASLAEVAKYFDVWVYDYYHNENVAPTLSTYQAITEANSGWVSVGSLDKLLAGKAVLEGNMVTVRQDDRPDDATTPNGTKDGVKTTDTYTIALHMKEDADSAVMGQKISLSVKLVAYQKSSESDDLGMTDYDQLVATEKDLREAFQNGGQVTLLEDIVLTEGLTVASDKTVILDLNGHTISQTEACTGSYAMINNKGTLKITGNGKLSFTDIGTGDPNFDWGSYTVQNSGILVVENGTIEHLGVQAAGTHCIQAIFHYSGSTTINGGTISVPNYRAIRLWHGDMKINGGVIDGQLWVQTQTGESAKLTINGGSFSPNGNDMSSVFVENDKNTVEFSVTGGEFETKIGATKPEDLIGSISGGVFTDDAKSKTADILFAASFEG